jgi:hypothetical protein
MRVFPVTVHCGAILAVVLAVSAAWADEAILHNGSKQEGSLERDAKGRLGFQVPGRTPPLPLRDIQTLRLAPGELTPWRAPAVHRVVLHGEQRLSGELLELDEKELRLRTPWSPRLAVPRTSVRSVSHPPGWVTFWQDDFENDPKAWRLSGAVERANRQRTSGQHGLRLGAAGQSAEFVLPEPLEAGRVGINFFDPGPTASGRWLVEAEFQRPGGPWGVRVVIAGSGERYGVELPEPSRPIARTEGWHRLTLRFARGYLLVGVDDRPLWGSEKQGPGGPLVKLRLLCTSPPGAGAVRGEVFFDDLSLARTAEELPHQVEDGEQDEAWLLPGDQLCGRVLRADARAVELRGRASVRRLPWSEVRGLFLRREAPPPRTTDGEHVRLRLHAAGGGEPDELEGVVAALDAQRLRLQHAVLGDLELERGRVRQLQPLFHGQRIELDNGFHHLGDTGRIVPELRPARAAGPSLRRTFRLDEVPDEVRLVIGVVHLKGPGDGVGAALQRGELRTEVVVNGQRVDYLNRLVDRSSAEPRWLSVLLPRRLLRRGENSLELRQTPQRDTERLESCGILGLAIEVPR